MCKHVLGAALHGRLEYEIASRLLAENLHAVHAASSGEFVAAWREFDAVNAF